MQIHTRQGTHVSGSSVHHSTSARDSPEVIKKFCLSESYILRTPNPTMLPSSVLPRLGKMNATPKNKKKKKNKGSHSLIHLHRTNWPNRSRLIVTITITGVISVMITMENHSIVPSWIDRAFGATGVKTRVVSILLFPVKPGPLAAWARMRFRNKATAIGVCYAMLGSV